MGLTTFAKNKQANSITYDKASIHTAAPTDDGSASEVSGGAPAYARKAISFTAAALGARDSEVAPEFDIPAGTTITHYALWEGANCVATGPLENSEAYAGQGKYTLTDVDITNS